jgi:hypothetical protein
MGTSAYHMGITAHQMGTAKSYKKQNLSVRKKQNLSVRKNADHDWASTNRRQSDTETQKDFQQRFEKLGGVGIVSPEEATLQCGPKTKFYGKHINVGIRGVSPVKRKRWEMFHLSNST